MTRKPRSKSADANSKVQVVDFRYDDKNYKIDLQSRRVYRNWVSVEAARSITILSAYRHASA